MLDPLPDGRMDGYEVSTKVNSPANHGPDWSSRSNRSMTGLDAFGESSISAWDYCEID